MVALGLAIKWPAQLFDWTKISFDWTKIESAHKSAKFVKMPNGQTFQRFDWKNFSTMGPSSKIVQPHNQFPIELHLSKRRQL